MADLTTAIGAAAGTAANLGVVFILVAGPKAAQIGAVSSSTAEERISLTEKYATPVNVKAAMPRTTTAINYRPLHTNHRIFAEQVQLATLRH